MERGRGSYGGRSSYGGRGYTSGDRYGGAGRNSYGDRRGRLSSGNEQRCPSQPQPRAQWQPKLKPSSSAESSEPFCSQRQTETKKQNIQNSGIERATLAVFIA